MKGAPTIPKIQFYSNFQGPERPSWLRSQPDKVSRPSEPIGWMKRDVILVNTWRGAVLDEVALIRCLKERKITDASLDVFAQESLDKNNPLKERDNAILASHNAALTQECVIRLAVEAVQSALAVLEGKRPDGIANPEVLTHPRRQKFP